MQVCNSITHPCVGRFKVAVSPSLQLDADPGGWFLSLLKTNTQGDHSPICPECSIAGVPDGSRTRNLLIHSEALCR